MPFLILHHSVRTIKLAPNLHPTSTMHKFHTFFFSFVKRTSRRNIEIPVTLSAFLFIENMGVAAYVPTCLYVCMRAAMYNAWISRAGQIKVSSLPAHFHSHLSADLQEALRADVVPPSGP